jgi:hypothetical protein
MDKIEATTLAGIIRREGDTKLLDLGQLRIEGRGAKCYVSVIGKGIGPLAFHTYEHFIGSKWHDIERPEREARDEEERANWWNLSRVDARIATQLLGIAEQARRLAEEAEAAERNLSRMTDKAIESGDVELLPDEFRFKVHDILRRLQNLPGNAVSVETLTENLSQIRAICGDIKRGA